LAVPGIFRHGFSMAIFAKKAPETLDDLPLLTLGSML
jgi:hypothetical protein